MKSISIKQPRISILIAARNEEANILSCLQAIAALDYPTQQLEVWIGDDQSTDKTAQLVHHFIKDRPRFHLKAIQHTVGNARGKANVLAQLAHKATGELFCITDADVQIPTTWLKGLLAHYHESVGMITGVTLVSGKSLFAKLQSLDWLNALSLIKLASDVGKPVTAMGNNMLISKKAYFSTGGYEKIPFSVTEDFELFRAIRQQGWKSRQLLATEVLAFTTPVSNFIDLLQQRKRWMKGAMQVPWYVLMALAGQVAFYPILLYLLITMPLIGASIWASKVLLQSVWTSYYLIQLKETKLLPYLLFYEIYFILLSLSSVLFYLLPISVKWKDRTYH